MKTKEKDECSYSVSNAIRTLVMNTVTELVVRKKIKTMDLC